MMDQRYICVPAFKQYIRMAHSCGLDWPLYLQQAGIDRNSIDNNCNRIASGLLEKFLRQVIIESNDVCFGLHTANFLQCDTYGVLGYIAFNCNTLKEYWQYVTNYEKIVSDVGVSDLALSNGLACFRWQCQLSDALVKRHVTESVIASWYQYSKLIFSRNAHPVRVDFSHCEPADSSILDHYRQFFHCDVVFNQAHNGIWVDDKIVDLCLPQANKALLSTLLAHAREELDKVDSPASTTGQVKTLLRQMISEGTTSRELVARQMFISGRHLQRKLHNEGTSYNQLLKELRVEMAEYYLQSSSMSVDEISAKLGFFDTRSFYRSFKQWTGQTIGVYKKSVAARRHGKHFTHSHTNECTQTRIPTNTTLATPYR